MRRRQISPPEVVHKIKRATSGNTAASPAARRATPDRRIRAWSSDDTERQEQEAFARKPDQEQLQDVITAWCARFRRVNDPEVEQRIAVQAVGHDLTDHAMSHMQIIEDPRDPRVILRPHPGRWDWLKRGLGMQYAASKRIVTDPKAPARSSPWWTFIRDLRKNTK